MGIDTVKRVLFGILLAMSSVQAAAASARVPVATPASGENVLTMRVDGELTIGTEGQVLTYKIRSKLDPQLQTLLDKAIPRWRLSPVRQGGKPVNARTPMRITLAATQVPQGYEVRLDNVVFKPISKEDYEAQEAAVRARLASGESLTVGEEPPSQTVVFERRQMQPPGYPFGLMRAGVEGMVLLRLRLNPDGTVADAMASQSSLFNIKGSNQTLDRARGLREKESLRAARHWAWTVTAAHPERLTAEDLTISVPVEFRMGSSRDQTDNRTGGWRQEFRGPTLPVPWLMGKDGQQLVGVSDLNNGEQVTGGSVFQLNDRSVLGRAL